MPSYKIEEPRYVSGLALVKDDGDYGTLVTPIDIQQDTNYYVVLVVYSTGDSFSHTDGLRDYVEIYRTREEAEETSRLIRQHYDFYKDYPWLNECKATNYSYLGKRQQKFADLVFGGNFTVKIKNGDGVEYKYHAPWMGYFEAIQEIEVIKLQLK